MSEFLNHFMMTYWHLSAPNVKGILENSFRKEFSTVFIYSNHRLIIGDKP